MKVVVLASILAGLALPAAAEVQIVQPESRFGAGLKPAPVDACAKLFSKTSNGDAGGPLPFKRLDQLPQSHVILAVMLKVDGCPVTETRSGGVNVYVAPSIPTVSPAKPLPLASR
jgi:hypothetical protein